MATYAELVAEVLLIVPRAGDENLIKAKINQIIRFISTSGYFWRDIVEVIIGSIEGVNATSYLQSIPITTATRKLIYVDYPIDDQPRIECVNLVGLRKRRKCGALQDVAYLSGNALHIKHTKLSATFKLSYYTNPVDLVADGDSNWITILAPGLVIDMVSSYILNLKGDTEDSKRIENLSAMLRSTYIRDFMDSIEA